MRLEHRAWSAALACFLVAGAAGLLFRVGLLTGLPAGLELADVRHAHSHLMFYGWATGGLLALLAARTRRAGLGDGRGLRRLAWAAVLAGALAFPPFLLDGYGATRVAGVALPLSLAASSANALVWYAAAWTWWRRTRGAARTRPLRLLDAAFAFLVLASLAPLGRGVASALDLGGLAEAATVGAFLGWFTDGWLLLAVLGLAWWAHPAGERFGRLGQRLVVAGLPLAFLLGLPSGLLAPWARGLGALGGAALAAGLVVLALALARQAVAARAGVWVLPLLAVLGRAVVELASLAPAAADWGHGSGARVLVLHLLLLGAVSTGLWAAAAEAWRHPVERAALPWWSASVVVLLLGLVPVSGVWPAAWAGAAPWVAAVTSVPPLFVVASVLVGHALAGCAEGGCPVESAVGRALERVG